MLGLYLHVPFCHAICSYCNFNRGLFDETLASRYVDALAREIAEAGQGEPADTIFFGGGTPSILQPADIARLITACRNAYGVSADAEITLETNPETVTADRMTGWREAGVTRLSFGAQSFDDDELKRLGRIHSADRIDEVMRIARDAGFDNVSLDLMCWLPGQSAASWRRSVERAIALSPDHLSLYLLELYPNAPLREAMARATAAAETVEGSTPSSWIQAADDDAADMYLTALERLDDAGFAQYEISNVARPDRASRHNLKYWTGGAWRGFGCGAHSTVDGERWQNVSATRDYIDRVASGQELASVRHRLTPKEQIEEALFTGLRLASGIDCSAFARRFGLDPWSRYGDALAGSVEAGLVWRTPDAFGLTRAGMLMSNEVAQLFV